MRKEAAGYMVDRNDEQHEPPKEIDFQGSAIRGIHESGS
jgi:hypothetical protein